MTNRNPLLDQFRGELKDLWRRCGSPAFTDMVETSARLSKLYPDNARIQGLPSLSTSTISAVVNGQRMEVPRGNWVAAYVITCLHLGWTVGAVEDKPTEAVLMGWQYKRYLACAGPDTPPGPAPESGAGTPELPLPAPVMENSADVEIPRLDPDERAHVAESGAAGALLLHRYANGDTNACYQIAVLLAALHGRLRTCHDLLIYAASDYHHPTAADLLDDYENPEALAVHAEMIASAANDPPIATVFAECAHACRNRPARPGPLASD